MTTHNSFPKRSGATLVTAPSFLLSTSSKTGKIHQLSAKLKSFFIPFTDYLYLTHWPWASKSAATGLPSFPNSSKSSPNHTCCTRGPATSITRFLSRSSSSLTSSTQEEVGRDLTTRDHPLDMTQGTKNFLGRALDSQTLGHGFKSQLFFLPKVEMRQGPPIGGGDKNTTNTTKNLFHTRTGLELWTHP